MLHALSNESDRVALTVRVDRTGRREWLDASGTVALVWWEPSGEYWNARQHEMDDGVRRDTEQEALDWLLTPQLAELRAERRG